MATRNVHLRNLLMADKKMGQILKKVQKMLIFGGRHLRQGVAVESFSPRTILTFKVRNW